MTQMRILAMTKSTGGLAFYNRMLLRAMSADRFVSHTLCLSEDAEAYAESLNKIGLGAEAVAMERYRLDPRRDWSTFRTLLERVRAHKPDVLVLHGSKAGVMGRIIGWWCDIPTVYCQASLPFERRIQGNKAPFYWALEFVTRWFGGHIVALTQGAKETTARRGIFPADRITVIHTGVDTDMFSPKGRRDEVIREFGFDPARPVIGWIGRLEPQKAPLEFIQAVARLVESNPEAQVVIAGEGELKAQSEALIAKNGLDKNVRLLAWQTDMPRVLEGFDIYALSSHWEGLPITLLEAMATGCVPVTTDVDGCKAVVEDGVSGFTLAAGDVEIMAARLHQLLAAPDMRAEMQRAARMRVVQSFNRNGMIDGWETLLTRLAAQSRTKPLRDARPVKVAKQ